MFGAHSLLSYDEPVEFVRGEGVWLYDRQGTPFLDAYNNVPSVGHAHPRVVEAISRQAAAVNTNTRYLDDVVCSYAEKLLSTFPPSLSNVVLTCTGSESVDLALRLMRNASGADGFVVTRFAYHGNTRASTEISPSYGGGAAPADHVRAVPPPDGYRGRGKDIGESFAEDVRQAIRDLRSRGIGFAGFVADTIFSSDGVFADPPGFLSKTAEVVRSEGGLFLADEVQPGLGRTGDSMWGFQRHGVLPDLVVLGKPMGNGLPVAGVVVRPDILGDFLRRTGYFNTFGGNSVCCAAGHAVLEIVESERLVENARQVGSRLIRGLSDLSRKYPLIGDVRGAGLYIGVELVKDPCSMEPASEEARRIVNGFRAKHVLIGATGQNGHILKIRPPLVFSRENAEQFLSVADEVLESTAK
ncbi:MAG: aminotransferase class III-fold pyridoxal phosphate-dependent enzyme [Deltaproteobacteria bacterium]|nr:aminotransferase class III-fold pyridoxal phosphate-dependent enzyme [Candidatus Deferrimicrobiaceae bacterium]